MRKQDAIREDTPLLLRERLFVEEYMVDLNGTRAAIRAKYSAKTARSIASQLLAQVNIRKAVDEALKERSERTKITADEILKELAILARSDVRHFRINPKTGRLKLAPGIEDSAWRAVSSVKLSMHTVQLTGGKRRVTHDVEVKLWPKVEAIKVARDHLGLNRDAAPLDAEEQARRIRDALRMGDELEGLSHGGG